MKNNFFLALLILVGTALYAFEDKPALTRTQRLAAKGVRSLGMGVGGAAGAAAGGSLGLGTMGVYKVQYPDLIPEPQKKVTISSLQKEADQQYALEMKEYHGKIGQPAVNAGIAAAAVGIPVGAAAGYKTAGAFNTYALSRWHKVSYRVERVSHRYNINIEQYRPLLIAADVKDKVMLRAAVLEIYNARFGKHWHERLRSFFADASNLEQLLKAKRSKLSSDEQDAFRMVELGAAMAELYFGKKISSKNRVGSAVEIYHELGLL